MEEQIAKTKANLLQKIDSLEVSSERKEMMRQVLDALFIAPRGRLYLQDENDSTNQYRFKKFITLRRREDTVDGKEADFDFCIGNRMENIATGFCEQKQFEFLSLSEIEAMINQSKDRMMNEINNAHYYNNAQAFDAGLSQAKQQSKTAYEMYLDNMKERINDISGATQAQRARVLDVIDTLAKSQTGKIKTKDEEGFTEYLVLNKDSKNYGIHASSRYYDTYSGATIGRDITTLAAKGLVKYCEENKVSIDKGLAKLKLENSKEDKQKEDGPEI